MVEESTDLARMRAGSGARTASVPANRALDRLAPGPFAGAAQPSSRQFAIPALDRLAPRPFGPAGGLWRPAPDVGLPQAGPACRRTPSAFTTLSTVAKLGLPFSLRAR